MRLCVVLTLAGAAMLPAQEALHPAKPEPAKVAEERPVRMARPSGRYSGTPEEAAARFVAEHRELYGSAQLRTVQSRRLGGRSFVRMQQVVDGLPVLGSEAVIRVDPSGGVRAVRSHIEQSSTKSGDWRLDENTAIERALAAHGSAASDTPRAERAYMARERALHPVWRIVFRAAEPPGDWEYVISAESGRVFSKQNLRAGAHALGYAYPRNPVRGGREQVGLPNLVSDTNLTSDQTVVLTHLPALRGAVPPGRVVQGATRQNGNFFYDADDARAAEVQLYYGMETASERFFNLGFYGFERPMPGVVYFQDWDAENKRFVGSDNAFFSPVAFGENRGGMFFYLTSRNADTSLDTDVIFHEYTHAVINDLVGPRQSPVFQALNEGTADYFANSFLDDPIMAEYAAKIFALRTPFLRRSDNENTWPYYTVGESHADGNIWSGALWDVRSALGASKADEIALNAIAMLSPTSEFFDAAEAAIEAAGELFGNYEAQVVAGVMKARGIYSSSAQTASNALWLASGEVAEGSMRGADPGYLLIGRQQYRIDVPAGATKLRVRVRASSDVRFYIRYRVPVMVEDGKIRAEQVSNTAVDPDGYLSLENTPELQAGTYYIAVVNTTTSPVDYALRLDVEGGDSGLNITVLEDGVRAAGSAPSGPFLASRQFAVRVPEGLRAVQITLDGNEDVDLYVRLGKPVYITGTGFPQADVVSDSASSREVLNITSVDGGAPPAGVYFIGVYNYARATSVFDLRVKFVQ